MGFASGDGGGGLGLLRIKILAPSNVLLSGSFSRVTIGFWEFRMV